MSFKEEEIVDKCVCVSKHVPLPIKYLTTHNTTLCPTAYSNLQSLLSQYETYKGTPPGYVRKHYSDFIQNLARSIMG